MSDVDDHLATNACIYAWALVPSYYLYSFLDTNKNYLQSQGIIFPPIIIHFASVVLHVIICSLMVIQHGEVTFLKLAWTKNLTDCVCCIGLYAYIVIK